MKTQDRQFENEFARIGEAIAAPKWLGFLDLFCQVPCSIARLAKRTEITVALPPWAHGMPFFEATP